MRRSPSALTALLLALSLILSCAALTSCEREQKERDDNVYDSHVYSKSGAYFVYKYGVLNYTPFSDLGNAYYACIRPFCPHYAEVCPAAIYRPVRHWLVVESEGRRMPLVYMFGARPSTYYVDGELMLNPDANLGMTSVYDTETGEGHVIAETDFTGVRYACFYHDRIYMTVEYIFGGLGFKVGSIDVESGEYNEIETRMDASLLGIYDGRIYYMTLNGKIYSCDEELSDIREEYDIGHERLPGINYMQWGYVSDGILYFIRSARDEEPVKDYNRYTVCDICSVRLSDETRTETVVAEGVHEFKASGGDLYYTIFNYKEYGVEDVDVGAGETLSEPILSFDDGTLYRYSADTQTTETLCVDAGICFEEIYDVADGFVMFRGDLYRDQDKYDTLNSVIYLCRLNIETGEWEEVYGGGDG